MMRYLFLLLFVSISCSVTFGRGRPSDLKLFRADDPHIQYYGRIDNSNPQIPRIWAPGVYIAAKFKGAKCQVLIDDEAGGANHNYLEIVIDGKDPYRIELTAKENALDLPVGLSDSEHTL